MLSNKRTNAAAAAAMDAKGERLRTNLSWEHEVQSSDQRSKRVAWAVAGVMTLIAVMAWAAVMGLMPLKKVVNNVVMVDRLTGENQIVGLAQDHVATSTISDKHWVQRFVIARERYNFRFIQYDYDTVKLLAGDKVWPEYSRQFSGTDPLDKRYGDNIELIPRILSITITDNKTATVRYVLETKDHRLVSPPKTEARVATLRFDYEKRTFAKESEAIQNPLGFQVYAYQTVPELGGAR